MVHTHMEYYLATRKKERVPPTPTWKEFEGIMLSEINQNKKDKKSMTLLICGLYKQNKTETSSYTERTDC